MPNVRAGRREWIGLAVLALPCLLYSMDLTVLHQAIPTISEELKPSSVELLWIIDIYGFLVAGSLITMGTLGDRIGRRRLLLAGALAFGAGSVLAAFAPSAKLLIGARALLGLAGATIAPSTLSLIRNMFADSRQRTVAISVWMASYSVGGAIGPLIGGVLLEYFWWGSVFLINVPVMVLLLVIGPLLLPEYRDPNARRLDVFSALLSLSAVLSVIYGLKQIAQDGVALVPLLSIAGGTGLAIFFVRRQLALEDPLLDLRLFGETAFSVSLATYGLGVLLLFGGFLFLPQYLQSVHGLSPFTAGLWTLPWALSFVVGSSLTPLVARRMKPARLMALGLVTAALGFALFTGIDESTSFLGFGAGTTMFALGMAPVFTLTTDAIVGAAPPERAGVASALSETSAEFGGAFGIALFGSVGVAAYRSVMSSAPLDGVPAELAEAARATIGGAIAAAKELPGDAGADLLRVARSAFLRGVRISAAISATGSAVLAVVVVAMLRAPRSATEPQAPRVGAAERPE